MKVTIKTVACIAVSTAFLIGAAAPAHAQGVVANGGGVFLPRKQDGRRFALSLVEQGNGSVSGSLVVVVPAKGSVVRVAVTSYVRLGHVLAMAGPVTAAINAPPQFVIGATAFFAVRDGGRGAADGLTGTTVLPLSYGHVSIQRIIKLLGGGPPPSSFYSLAAGNIRIR